MNLNLCKEFDVRKTSTGTSYVVVTPFKYYDGDQVTIFVRNTGNDTFQVTDNGEASLRLAFDNVDPESPRISAWIQDLEPLLGVSWHSDDGSLEIEVVETNIGQAIISVAEASIQLQAMTATRSPDRATSDFKDKVIQVLREIEAETGIKAHYDTPIDGQQLFIADALFLSDTPLAIVIATSTQRLLEAEMMWLNAQRLSDPTMIFAVVESSKKVGQNEVARANYFTHKTFEFAGFSRPFHDVIAGVISTH